MRTIELELKIDDMKVGVSVDIPSEVEKERAFKAAFQSIINSLLVIDHYGVETFKNLDSAGFTYENMGRAMIEELDMLKMKFKNNL